MLCDPVVFNAEVGVAASWRTPDSIRLRPGLAVVRHNLFVTIGGCQTVLEALLVLC